MRCKVGSGNFSVGPPCENKAVYGWPGVVPEDLRGPFMCEEHFKSGRFKTDPPLIKIKGDLRRRVRFLYKPYPKQKEEVKENDDISRIG